MPAPTNYFIYMVWVILEEIIVQMLELLGWQSPSSLSNKVQTLLILLVSEAATSIGVSLTCFIFLFYFI